MVLFARKAKRDQLVHQGCGIAGKWTHQDGFIKSAAGLVCAIEKPRTINMDDACAVPQLV